MMTESVVAYIIGLHNTVNRHRPGTVEQFKQMYNPVMFDGSQMWRLNDLNRYLYDVCQ